MFVMVKVKKMKTKSGIERSGPSILGPIGEAALRTPLPSPRYWIPKHFTGKIKVGSFYEIEHSKLPSTAPHMLRCVRVVLVTAKTEMNVTVRYPSTKSLESYFESGEDGVLTLRLYPSLDEKFVMGPILSVEVLGRVISSEEFDEHKYAKSFWLIDCFSLEKLPSPVSVCDVPIPREVKKGPLLLDLQSQLKGWGSQRVVAYLPDSPVEMDVSPLHEEMSVCDHRVDTSVCDHRVYMSVHHQEEKSVHDHHEDMSVRGHHVDMSICDHFEAKNVRAHTEDMYVRDHHVDMSVCDHLEGKNVRAHGEETGVCAHGEEMGVCDHVEGKSVHNHLEGTSVRDHPEEMSVHDHIEGKNVHVDDHTVEMSVHDHTEEMSVHDHIGDKNVGVHDHLKEISAFDHPEEKNACDHAEVMSVHPHLGGTSVHPLPEGTGVRARLEAENVRVHHGGKSVHIHPEGLSARVHPKEMSVCHHPEGTSARIHPKESSACTHPKEMSARPHPEETSVCAHPKEPSVCTDPEVNSLCAQEASVRVHPEVVTVCAQETNACTHPEVTTVCTHPEQSSVCSHQEHKTIVKKEEETVVIKERVLIPYTRKRKRSLPIVAAEETKKIKHSPKVEPVECKAIITRNTNQGYVQRWPAKRYEAAARQLCEVLETNRAVHGNPITRCKLRAQARTRIGDTGLLDNLLKHLAGKVVPGGEKRLRRRCDADGKMEYWLESADLVQIRKEAGVKDPYWAPPPGWKLGDCVGPQSCLCGEERKKHKEEVSRLKREIEALKSRNVGERAIALVRQDSSVSFGRQNGGGLMLTGSKRAKYEALMKKRSQMEKQFLEISQALMSVEEDMKALSNPSEDASNDEGGESGADSRLKLRLKVRKLKPCDHQDDFSTSPSQAANHNSGEEDHLVLTASDWTPPGSTTTSLTTH